MWVCLLCWKWTWVQFWNFMYVKCSLSGKKFPSLNYTKLVLALVSAVFFFFCQLVTFRFPQCNQSGIWPVQDPHLQLHWWTCYQCHLEERWSCDTSQCYQPADQESSGSCWGYLPNSAHYWPASESEWHSRVNQLHSGECQGKLIKGSGYTWQW